MCRRAARQVNSAGGFVKTGRSSQISVRSLEPTRALVLGRDAGTRRWTWQFEISVLDERHTRLTLRDRARVAATISGWLFLAASRAFLFVLTRKMLLDVKKPPPASLPFTSRKDSELSLI